MPPELFDLVLAVFAFLVGTIVGSFLNVCIYRMPLGLSVNEPKRSFCPNCKKQIPVHRNIPIFSWLLLRGKCADCGARISARYLGVELLTGLLFYFIWRHFGAGASGSPAVALAYCLLISLFIVATFIDFEHFIIPDEVTKGGTVVGVLLSALIPALHETSIWYVALGWSVFAAALGYGTLWGVVELGKLAFGKKRVVPEEPSPFSWTRAGEDANFEVCGESILWSEQFGRESDRLIIEVERGEVRIDGESVACDRLVFHWDRVVLGDGERMLDDIGEIAGVAKALVIPREAMGFGDVKFIAAIGAFLGWQAVFFTIFSASIIGAAVGVATLAVGHREWSAKIPFGPYLALGATIWIFFGAGLLAWYLGLLVVPEY